MTRYLSIAGGTRWHQTLLPHATAAQNRCCRLLKQANLQHAACHALEADVSLKAAFDSHRELMPHRTAIACP